MSNGKRPERSATPSSAIRLGQADSDAFPGYDQNRALFHRVRVLFNQGVHGVGSLRRCHFDETYNACVRKASQEYERTEVIVLRDQHAPLPPSEGKQRFVCGIRKALACKQHVVARSQ